MDPARHEFRMQAAHALLKKNPVLEDWDVRGVVQLLRVIGLSNYCSAFEAADVDGVKLMEMTESALREGFGMDSQPHRDLLLEVQHSLMEKRARPSNRTSPNKAKDDFELMKQRVKSKMDFWTPGKRALIQQQSQNATTTSKPKSRPTSAYVPSPYNNTSVLQQQLMMDERMDILSRKKTTTTNNNSRSNSGSRSAVTSAKNSPRGGNTARSEGGRRTAGSSPQHQRTVAFSNGNGNGVATTNSNNNNGGGNGDKSSKPDGTPGGGEYSYDFDEEGGDDDYIQEDNDDSGGEGRRSRPSSSGSRLRQSPSSASRRSVESVNNNNNNNNNFHQQQQAFHSPTPPGANRRRPASSPAKTLRSPGRNNNNKVFVTSEIRGNNGNSNGNLAPSSSSSPPLPSSSIDSRRPFSARGRLLGERANSPPRYFSPPHSLSPSHNNNNNNQQQQQFPHPPNSSRSIQSARSRRSTVNSDVKAAAERARERIQKMLPPVLDKLRQAYGPKRRVDQRTPAEKLAGIQESIREAEQRGALDELVALCVENIALTRIVHGDISSNLVNAHFNLGTTYLRMRMVAQAFHHFSLADSGNSMMLGDIEAISFRPRILEGLGICETRQLNFSQAETHLQKAFLLSVQQNGSEEHPSLASIFVAKSELFLAKNDFEQALENLQKAWVLKEEELGRDNVQVGKLLQAMARIRQRQLKSVNKTMNEIIPMLNAMREVKREFDLSLDRKIAAGGSGEVDKKQKQQYDELVNDIHDMEGKHNKLDELKRKAQDEALDFLKQAYGTYMRTLGPESSMAGETAKTIYTLAVNFENKNCKDEFRFAAEKDRKKKKAMSYGDDEEGGGEEQN